VVSVGLSSFVLHTGIPTWAILLLRPGGEGQCTAHISVYVCLGVFIACAGVCVRCLLTCDLLYNHRATPAHYFSRRGKLYDSYLYTSACVLSLSASVCCVSWPKLSFTSQGYPNCLHFCYGQEARGNVRYISVYLCRCVVALCERV